MRLAPAALALLAALAAPAQAGPTFTVTPSAETANVNGLEVAPYGRDFILTNTLVSRTGDLATPLYLDFGLAFDRADASTGALFFRPKSDALQLYILPGILPQPTATARALFVGESMAVPLGGGRFRFDGDLIGSFDAARLGATDTPGHVDLEFDLGLAPGRQVLGGTVAFGEPARGVPEPAGAVLVGLGIVILGVLEGGRRGFWRAFGEIGRSRGE